MSFQPFETQYDSRRHKPRESYIRFSKADICYSTNLLYDILENKRKNKKFRCNNIESLVNFIIKERVKNHLFPLTAEQCRENYYKNIKSTRRKIKISYTQIAEYLNINVPLLRAEFKKYKINTSDLYDWIFFIYSYKNNKGYCPICKQKITRSQL